MQWDAYPRLKPRAPENTPPFRLAPGLWYANALESYASAVEISAVAAKNCVLGLMRDLRAPRTDS